ncbi:hypothetical protein ACFL3C_04480 [Patescibacteria group bacterium]
MVDGAPQAESRSLRFINYEVALATFKAIYDEGQKARENNDHEVALDRFREAQGIIKAAREQGFDEFEFLFKEATLHFAVTECLTILQEPPREIMGEYHEFGVILENMICSLGDNDPAFRSIRGFFEEGFTFTDLDSLDELLDELGKLLEKFSIEDLSESQRATISMFYLLLSKYFEAIQDFYIYSTKHVEKAKACLRMYKDTTADMTLAYLKGIDEEEAQRSKIPQYKRHAETWFEITGDVMEAKMALYMQYDVGETKVALSSENEDKLWKIIKNNYPNAHSDEVARGTVLYAMEVLVEMYATDALLNMQYYEKAKERIGSIVEWCEELHRRGAQMPKKVLFNANLNLAKIAQKYVLDCMYNPKDVRAQLKEASDHEKLFCAAETVMRMPESTLEEVEDASTYVQAPVKVKINGGSMIGALTVKMHAALDVAYAEAGKYIPEGNETHRNVKEMALLKARRLMHEYTSDPDKAANLESLRTMVGEKVYDIMPAFQKHPLALRAPLIKLKFIEETVLDAVPPMQEQAFNYYRHLAEAYTIRARISIERAKVLRDYVFDDEERLEEQYAALDEAHQNICIALNILEELDDVDHTLRSELSEMHDELAVLKYGRKDKGAESPQEVAKRAAKSFRTRLWKKKFLDALRKPALGSDEDLLPTLDVEFLQSLQELVPHVSYLSGCMFDPDEEGEKNLYGFGDQFRTVVPLKNEPKYAVEIRSDDAFTGVEAMQFRYLLMYYESAMQVYIWRMRLNQKGPEIAVWEKERGVQYMYNQTERIAESVISEEALMKCSEEAKIARKLLLLFDIDGVDVERVYQVMKLSSIGLAYQNSPKSQVLRDADEADPTKLKYRKLGLEVLRGLIGEERLGNAFKIVDPSSDREGFTGYEGFAADMVKLADELLQYIKKVKIGIERPFENRKAFDSYLRSIKDINVTSIDAIRMAVKFGKMDDFDEYLFADKEDATLE